MLRQHTYTLLELSISNFTSSSEVATKEHIDSAVHELKSMSYLTLILDSKIKKGKSNKNEKKRKDFKFTIFDSDINYKIEIVVKGILILLDKFLYLFELSQT